MDAGTGSPMAGGDSVQLLAGFNESTGNPVHEELPARHEGDDRYVVLATPGLANGCAAGDTVLVDDHGRFTVVERGGNVAVHVYPPAVLQTREVEALQRLFEPLGGVVEAPDPANFVVVTVPVSAGFSAIEDAMDVWLAVRTETTWYFGNVYDEAGQPLGWWGDGE